MVCSAKPCTPPILSNAQLAQIGLLIHRSNLQTISCTFSFYFRRLHRLLLFRSIHWSAIGGERNSCQGKCLPAKDFETGNFSLLKLVPKLFISKWATCGNSYPVGHSSNNWLIDNPSFETKQYAITGYVWEVHIVLSLCWECWGQISQHPEYRFFGAHIGQTSQHLDLRPQSHHYHQ